MWKCASKGAMMLPAYGLMPMLARPGTLGRVKGEGEGQDGVRVRVRMVLGLVSGLVSGLGEGEGWGEGRY